MCALPPTRIRNRTIARYSNHNALGGELRAAGPPIHRAEVITGVTMAYEVPRAVAVDDPSQSEIRRASYSPRLQPFSMDERQPVTPGPKRAPRTTRHVKPAVVRSGSQQIGSAAADWSRWPAGTVFRLLSTGQNYRVEDYGWALAGRNTIDLYMANQRAMNSWGAREETIEVLRWGDPHESLQFLQRHQDYRHIKRMVLELKGHHKEAAALR